jgi:hypothetical protein
MGWICFYFKNNFQKVKVGRNGQMFTDLRPNNTSIFLIQKFWMNLFSNSLV